MVYNIGYLGIGKYNTTNISYTFWKSMLRRCYDKKHQLKNTSYIDCFVHDDWLNFQNFAKWFDNNYIENFHLDKDILFKNNKIYGPNTCCFVPLQINNLFKTYINNIGIYPNGKNFIVRIQKFGKTKNFGTFNNFDDAKRKLNIEKENYYKEVAEIWKNKIPENIYNILINYKFE